MKYDVSIEFAHLYADQYFSAEQQHSLAIAARRRRELVTEGRSVTTLIMIDDLHASELISDPSRVRQDTLMNGSRVDTVIFESALIPGSLVLISSIPANRTWTETFRREQKQVLFTETAQGPTPLLTIKRGRNLPSCAVLSATLLLTRLGALRSIPGVLPATSAVTVIEERFRFLEESALSLISMTSNAKYLDQIETIHFETPEECLLNAA